MDLPVGPARRRSRRQKRPTGGEEGAAPIKTLEGLWRDYKAHWTKQDQHALETHLKHGGGAYLWITFT